MPCTAANVLRVYGFNNVREPANYKGDGGDIVLLECPSGQACTEWIESQRQYLLHIRLGLAPYLRSDKAGWEGCKHGEVERCWRGAIHVHAGRR